MNESIELKGQVNVRLFDEYGQLKQEHTDHNLIVTVGKAYLTAWLAAASQANKFMPYIAVGTNATAPLAGNIALGAELTGGGNSRALGILSSNNNTWTNMATFLPGNCTGTITEAGLFSASSVGTMFARQTFTPYIKSASDTLVVSWTVTLS